MDNLKLNKCWISNEKAENPGAITWMKMEIDSDGEVVSQEFILHVRVGERDYDTTKKWLESIGRL